MAAAAKLKLREALAKLYCTHAASGAATSASRQGASLRRQEAYSLRAVTSAFHEETSSRRKDASSRQQDASSCYQDASSPRAEASSRYKETSSRRQCALFSVAVPTARRGRDSSRTVEHSVVLTGGSARPQYPRSRCTLRLCRARFFATVLRDSRSRLISCTRVMSGWPFMAVMISRAASTAALRANVLASTLGAVFESGELAMKYASSNAYAHSVNSSHCVAANHRPAAHGTSPLKSPRTDSHAAFRCGNEDLSVHLRTDGSAVLCSRCAVTVRKCHSRKVSFALLKVSFALRKSSGALRRLSFALRKVSGPLRKFSGALRKV